jgi:predicted permease
VRVWEYSFWQQIRQRPELFESAAAWSLTRFNLASGGESQFVEGLWATGSFFDTLGVEAALGRAFSDRDDRRGGGPDGPVAVISDSYWHRRFGRSADVLGRVVRLNDVPYTIVGVMPPRFFGTEVGRAFDFIVPLHTEPLSRGRDSAVDNPGTNFLTVIARLGERQGHEAGVTALRLAQPVIREAVVAPFLQMATPELLAGYLSSPFTVVTAETGFSNLRGQYERPLMVVSVVVALVLVVACVNIASLLLARAVARRQELKVRMALGASRWRLARQLFTESLALAVAGAGLGVAMAPSVGGFLVRQLSTPVDVVFLDTSIDVRVLAFAVAATAITVLLFGTVPALRATRVSPIDSLKERGPAVSDQLHGGAAGWLIAMQVAVSIVLVVSAGLFVRSFASLAWKELGFEPERVLVVTVAPERTTVDLSQRRALYERVRRAVLALPDVGDAAISFLTPVATGGLTPPVEVEGAASAIRDEVFGNPISPGWFTTFGIRLVAGRDITDGDRSGAPRVAIVNETFARRYLGSGSPLGRTITIWPNTPRALRMEVVGVAADAAYFSARAPVPPSWYSPIAQFDAQGFPFSPVRLSVRPTAAPPASLTRQVEAAVASVDPRLSLVFRPLDEQVHASLIGERLLAQLGGFFGALALLLAGLGLYGVTAYAVSRRRSEIGIRMALGAVPAGVIRLVLGRISMIVGAGIAAGTAISLWASPLVDGLIYGLRPRDPGTFAGAALALCATAAVAAWLPARRAVRIDPAAVLRE